MEKRKDRAITALLFVLYLSAMLLLLFHRVPREGHPYNMTPFYTIRTCWDLLRRSDPVALAHKRYALVNLLGNVAVFIPFGLFLPLLFQRERGFFLFLITTTLVICLIELAQLLTRRGALDIDDLILNVPGACLGWLGWRIWNQRKE